MLTQVAQPGITEEVALTARQGLNRDLGSFSLVSSCYVSGHLHANFHLLLVHMIEPLHEACLAAYSKEMPACPGTSPDFILLRAIKS